jgi:hypothetical protein
MLLYHLTWLVKTQQHVYQYRNIWHEKVQRKTLERGQVDSTLETAGTRRYLVYPFSDDLIIMPVKVQ